MKRILTHVFVTLGVIFLMLILFATYFFVTDPYNLKPLLFGSNVVAFPMPSSGNTERQGTDVNNEGVTEADDEPGTGATAQITAGFTLSEAQKQALINIGIDPSVVPTSVSASQEACFVSVLGEQRVAEIKAGAVPGPVEFVQARSCI